MEECMKNRNIINVHQKIEQDGTSTFIKSLQFLSMVLLIYFTIFWSEKENH